MRLLLPRWLSWMFADPAKYRIVQDPELGYCGQVRDYIGWWALEANGTSGVSADDAVIFLDYWCPDEANAGARINKHATSRGQKIIWSAP